MLEVNPIKKIVTPITGKKLRRREPDVVIFKEEKKNFETIPESNNTPTTRIRVRSALNSRRQQKEYMHVGQISPTNVVDRIKIQREIKKLEQSMNELDKIYAQIRNRDDESVSTNIRQKIVELRYQLQKAGGVWGALTNKSNRIQKEIQKLEKELEYVEQIEREAETEIQRERRKVESEVKEIKSTLIQEGVDDEEIQKLLDKDTTIQLEIPEESTVQHTTTTENPSIKEASTPHAIIDKIRKEIEEINIRRDMRHARIEELTRELGESI